MYYIPFSDSRQRLRKFDKADHEFSWLKKLPFSRHFLLYYSWLNFNWLTG